MSEIMWTWDGVQAEANEIEDIYLLEDDDEHRENNHDSQRS